jgi:glutamine amidotransferase-like uncharacterized protein
VNLTPHPEGSQAMWSLRVTLAGVSLCIVLTSPVVAQDGTRVGSDQEITLSPVISAAANNAAPILLFNGAGTSRGDVAAIELVLRSNHLTYATANSDQLNRLTGPQIAAYRLLIVPGGNFVEMGSGLSAATAMNVRDAVKGGLNYLGICAGGFLAGSFPSPYNSFNLTSGVKFGFYPAGARKAVVRITTQDGPALDQYWEDGPQFTGWGDTIGRYPDGTPAIVQGTLGKGWVVLSGIHAEAPESWRRGMKFATPASASTAYSLTLIDAALNRKDLARH